MCFWPNSCLGACLWLQPRPRRLRPRRRGACLYCLPRSAPACAVCLPPPPAHAPSPPAFAGCLCSLPILSLLAALCPWRPALPSSITYVHLPPSLHLGPPCCLPSLHPCPRLSCLSCLSRLSRLSRLARRVRGRSSISSRAFPCGPCTATCLQLQCTASLSGELTAAANVDDDDGTKAKLDARSSALVCCQAGKRSCHTPHAKMPTPTSPASPPSPTTTTTTTPPR